MKIDNEKIKQRILGNIMIEEKKLLPITNHQLYSKQNERIISCSILIKRTDWYKLFEGRTL